MYQQLLRSTAASTNPHTRPEGTIDRDLNRTFPRQQLFSAKGGMGQSLLRNVLVAYAMYDTSVGYCQGMNFFVGLLLCYMTEEVRAAGGGCARGVGSSADAGCARARTGRVLGARVAHVRPTVPHGRHV